jgi:hypothetical protein
MKRRGVLADDLDIEAELDELENEAPALGTIPATAGQVRKSGVVIASTRPGNSDGDDE